MFGTKRRSKASTIDWPPLRALLEDDDRRAAVERVFPQPRHESFLSALRRIDAQKADEVSSLGLQVQNATKLAEFPTLAVAGMLNSGKTSLVARLLSEHGRERTLRGVANRQGTHRFVLWLPQKWQEDSGLWQLLLDDFGSAVGRPAELLAETSEDAHAQYNNRTGDASALDVPLVATDPALDELGVGLLDCPDIVSDEVFGVGSPERRRELLGKAATFCSGFLIVSTPSMARDRTLGEILQTVSELMPGIPRFMAINKIRPGQTPEEIIESFEPQAKRFDVKRFYGAYDFEVSGSQPFIPRVVRKGDQLIDLPRDDDDPLPVFFSLSTNPDENPPAEITNDRLITELAKELDSPESSARFLIGRCASLRRAIWDVGLETITKDATDSEQVAARARRTMLETTVSLFSKQSSGGEIDEVRMHQSGRIVRQLTDAFCSAAPWYARWGVRINSFIQTRTKAATDIISRYTPTRVAESYAESIKQKFKSKKIGRVVDAAGLDASLRRYGAPLTLPNWFEQQNDPPKDARWNEQLEIILKSFDENDRIQFDSEQLQSVAEEMWRSVPSGKKLAFGLTPLAAMLAAFGSVLMLPFDFGATTMVANASIVELLAAAGLTALSAFWAGGKNTQALSRQAAIEQMAMFYVVSCQSLGVDPGTPLPTIQIKQTRWPFPTPNVSLPQEIDVERTLPVYRVRDSFESELGQLFPRTHA
ncbi:MAG: hypothetical protein AAF802_12580 [Planctomycetota bacterium]